MRTMTEMFEVSDQQSSPERSGRLKRFMTNVMEVIRREQEAIQHLRDVERVRRSRRLAGSWQGPAVWMMPGGLPAPSDDQGIIDVSRLSPDELKIALRLNMLSRDLLLPEDQQRLSEAREGIDYAQMGGLMEKLSEDYARHTPGQPNYS